jgi:hypothetical protein
LPRSARVAFAVRLHSRKYRRLHAPATNLDPGASPPDPLHSHSLAAPTARSVRGLPRRSGLKPRRRVARFAALARVFLSPSSTEHIVRGARSTPQRTRASVAPPNPMLLAPLRVGPRLVDAMRRAPDFHSHLLSRRVQRRHACPCRDFSGSAAGSTPSGRRRARC